MPRHVEFNYSILSTFCMYVMSEIIKIYFTQPSFHMYIKPSTVNGGSINIPILYFLQFFYITGFKPRRFNINI